LAYESRRKLIGFLKGPRNAEGYYPFTLNIGAARSARTSSDINPFGEGGNSQQLEKKRIEKITRPDRGYWQGSRDLSNAENRALPAYLGDFDSLAAFDGPYDSHSLTAQMCWPELDWPVDPIPHQRFARTYEIDGKSIRDLGKVSRHAIERFGTAHTISRNNKVSLKTAHEIVERIHAATPKTTAGLAQFKYELKYKNEVVVDVGVGSWAFPIIGNPEDDEVARQLISDVLQSIVWFHCSVIFSRLWHLLDEKYKGRGRAPFELLRHKHDEVKYQARKELFWEYDKKVQELCSLPLTFPSGAILNIPTSLDVIDEDGNNVKY